MVAVQVVAREPVGLAEVAPVDKEEAPAGQEQ